MGLGGMLDTAILESNQAFGKMASRFSSAAGRAKPVGAYANRVASTLKSTYNTGGFALKAGTFAGAGAAAGYAYDGTDSSALKGAFLGGLGAAAHTGWGSPSIRGLASDAMGAGKSMWGDARGWAKGQYQRQMNAAHVRQASRAGWTQ